MGIRPGYKQTEIGVIPEDWKIDYIGNHCSITTGKRNTQDSKATGIFPFFVRSQVVERINSYSYDGEAVLTAGDGVGTGKVVHYINGKFDFHQRVYCLSGFAQVLDGYYFYLFFKNRFLARIQQFTAKTSVDSVRLEMISKMPVALPPLSEQKHIAEVMQDIDSLITSIEKQIEKKKLIKQGVMQELLTGKGRLPGFSGEWETKRLGDVSVVIMGQSPDSKYYNTDSKGIPLIQGNADIQNGKSVFRIWTKSITKECQKGAILFTVRAPVGSIGISSSRACLGRGVCAIQPHSINDRYLFWQLKFSENKWNESQQGSTFTSVNSNQIKDFCILCPTSSDEQVAIADLIEDIEIEIDLHVKQLNKQILLKQAMMQELLTGRIRLV